MKNLYILIKELGVIEQISLTESLANLLWRDELGLTSVDSRDMRVSNLAFSYEMYETNLENYRHLLSLSVAYEKMDKAIAHYQQRYSLKLVNFIVGDISSIFQGLNSDETMLLDDKTPVDLDTLPQLVLQRIKQYFVDSFLIKDVKLSEEKHANIKYIDDTAEFHIVFTVLDMAVPNDTGAYERQPVEFDVFGRYQDEFTFYFDQIKTNKDRCFGYDEMLYDKRKEYLELILSRCKDKSGHSLKQALEQVAKEFVYDFWLE